jgi:hypothetical protein
MLSMPESLTPEQKLAQIMQLYKEHYISLEKAKDLALRHTGDVAKTMSWLGRIN